MTPPEQRETKVYEILPQEAADRVRDNGIPQPPAEQTSVSIEDFNPDAAIISPTLNAYIGGIVQIQGNARGGPYHLDFGRGTDPQQWTPIGSEHSNDVVNGPLETFDTRGLDEGLYALRLTVNRGDGPRVWTTPVTIDNTPPNVVISEPKPDQLFVMEDDEQININVLVNDTWAVGHVDYYIDNTKIATATVAPYNERWKITMRDVGQIETNGTQNWLGFKSDDPDVQPGRARPFDDGFMAIRTANGVYFESHVIKVKAYDRANNEADSNEIRVYVRHRKPKKE